MSPNVFEINEDKMNKNKCWKGILCNVFSCYVKEKIVGPVEILQDQYILGVNGPTGPVTFWVSIEAWTGLS